MYKAILTVSNMVEMFTDEDGGKLLSAFDQLGVKPRLIHQMTCFPWMKVLGQAETVKDEAPQVDDGFMQHEIPHVKEEKYHETALSRPPSLSTFTGEKTKGTEVPL